MMLSILLPTYNHLLGTKRILEQLSNISQEIEIIISDNSTNNEITKLTKEYKNINNLTYHKSNTEPAQNWNFLIQKAKGKYIWLLHHDESLLHKTHVEQLLEILKTKIPDILVMPTLLKFTNIRYKRDRLHLPKFIQKILINYFTNYVLKRNFIGPMSALIVKKNKTELFDTKLNWLVDQEWYYRIFQNSKDILFIPEIKIVSFQNEHVSLTNKMSKDLKRINEIEQKYIIKKHSISASLLFEPIIWFLIRLVSRANIFK
jgi:glycosyltransferase involved in cell wall biosynthesis